jgi:hypothetical protein
MARPTDGLKHVDRLQGPAEQKLRLRVVLEVLQGQRTVEEACTVLAIKPARFHELRGTVLAGAMAALVPGKAGRPKRRTAPSAARTLAEENEELKEELWAAQIREEIALTMPHLLKQRAGKKISSGRRRNRRRP